MTLLEVYSVGDKKRVLMKPTHASRNAKGTLILHGLAPSGKKVAKIIAKKDEAQALNAISGSGYGRRGDLIKGHGQRKVKRGGDYPHGPLEPGPIGSALTGLIGNVASMLL